MTLQSSSAINLLVLVLKPLSWATKNIKVKSYLKLQSYLVQTQVPNEITFKQWINYQYKITPQKLGCYLDIEKRKKMIQNWDNINWCNFYLQKMSRGWYPTPTLNFFQVWNLQISKFQYQSLLKAFKIEAKL